MRVLDTMPVTAYAGPPDPVDDALGYPGSRPEGSFITDGHQVQVIPSDYSAFADTANQYLSDRRLPLLEDRVPVLAYGANANPVRLQQKMAAFGHSLEMQQMMQTVPHANVRLPGMLAVWHGRPGQVGSVFAELYQAQGEDEVSLDTHVAYLTTEQLAAIHASEGQTYSAAELPVSIGTAEDHVDSSTLAYVGLKASVLLKGSKPVLVAFLKNNADGYEAMTPEEAVAYMLDGVSDQIGWVEVRDYVKEGLGMTLAERKARQAPIGRMLLEKGMSQEYVFPAGPKSLVGRADFTSIPWAAHNCSHHIHQTPEMVLDAIRPPAAARAAKAAELTAKNADLTPEEAYLKARKLVDPAVLVSSRALEELSTRTGLAIVNKTD